ncbi:MAG: PEGA domain-containing protein, partial [Candidatus Atribacteria bacterium]
PWADCLTSITGLCAPELWIGKNAPYEEALEKLAPIAAKHKNKFAASNNFNEVFEAIKAGRAVFGPVNLPPDYLNPPNGEWRPYGGSSAGGHAVPAMLVDEAERLIITRGSWDGDGGETWYTFGERFFNENAGPFLIGLTQDEARIGEALYGSCTITSTVPAEVTVDGVTIGITPQKIAIEVEKTYTVTVGAPGYVTQNKVVDDSMAEWHVILEPLPVPKKNWLIILIEFIRSLFERLKNGI